MLFSYLFHCHYLTRAGSSPTSDLGNEVVGLSSCPLVQLSENEAVICHLFLLQRQYSPIVVEWLTGERFRSNYLTWALWIDHVPVKPVVSGFVRKILASNSIVTQAKDPDLQLYSGGGSQKTQYSHKYTESVNCRLQVYSFSKGALILQVTYTPSG